MADRDPVLEVDDRLENRREGPSPDQRLDGPAQVDVALPVEQVRPEDRPGESGVLDGGRQERRQAAGVERTVRGHGEHADDLAPGVERCQDPR